MSNPSNTPAILSKTLRFLTAGGLTLAVAIWQELAKADTDWSLVATMAAGVIVGNDGNIWFTTIPHFFTGVNGGIGRIDAKNVAVFGMAGAHKFFHTPKDNLAAVNPDSLGPVVKAFAETLRAAR